MLNRSASLAMSTSVLKALTGKLDIKRHSPSISMYSAAGDRVAETLKKLLYKQALLLARALCFVHGEIHNCPLQSYHHC